MHEFRVWAPSAERVMLHLPGLDRREPMIRDDGRQDDGRQDDGRQDDGKQGGAGWWSARVDEAGAGTDYAFTVDGGDPRPDPRSAWQPDGVDGPSRVFDAGEHEWHDQEWQGKQLPGSVFYELHIGTFTPEGTFDAAAKKLDHLVELGVDFVEVLPIAAFPGRWGWGYDGVDLYAVHDGYGGPAAFQRFVDAAHQKGLGVALDVVYNHLGPAGNYLSEFGPYFTETHHTPWGAAVNLDAEGSNGVRNWIIDNALRWLREFHVDVLRLDAVHALVDTSPKHVLAELSDAVAELSSSLGRPLGLSAESDLNDPVMVDPTDAGGRGMTSQWDDDVHHALHALLTGERQGYYADFGSTAVLARVFTQVFRHAGDYSSFRQQVWGKPIDPARHHGHQFVAALQNHDQIGNRAVGDRLTASLSQGRLAAGAALLLTSPFTVLLFMGEEWGTGTPWQFFTSFPDPELGEAVRTGRRSEFADYGWDAEDVPDPQDPATRDRSVLDWAELEQPRHERLYSWYRALIALRRATPDLLADSLQESGGSISVEFGDDWVVLHRGAVHVLVNLGVGTAELPLPAGAQVKLAWTNDREATIPASSMTGLTLGPDEVAIAIV